MLSRRRPLPRIAALALLAATAGVHAAPVPSVQNGLWYGSNAFDSAFLTTPGAGDIVTILHEVTLRSEINPANPTVAALNLQGGTINVLQQMTLFVDGESTWSSGVYTGFLNGGGFVHNQGVVHMTGNITSFRELINTDQFILETGNLLMTGGSSFRNQSSTDPTDPSVGFLRFAGDTSILPADGGGGNNPILNNRGLIEKTGGAGISEIGVYTQLNGAFGGNQSGHVRADTGTIRFTAGGEGSGAHFSAASGASIEIASSFALSTDLTQVYTYTGSGAGHLRLVDGGSLAGTAPGNSGASAIDAPRAVLNFTGDFFHWTGGTILQGATQNVGQINAIGSATKALGGRLDNVGVISQRDDGAVALFSNALLRNSAAGQYTIAGDGDIVPGGGGGSTATLLNLGTLRKSAGTGLSDISIVVISASQIAADTGTLRFSEQFQSSGVHFSAAAGANIEMASAFYLSSSADLSETFTTTGSGEGHLRILPGAFLLGTSPGNSGGSPLDNPRAIINFTGDFFEWAGGTHSGGTTRNIGQVNITTDSPHEFTGLFDNVGTVIHKGGGPLNNNGRIRNGGEYNLASDADISPGGGAGFFDNDGVFRKSAGVGTSTIITNFTNAGLVRAESGTLEFTSFTNTGSLYVGPGATLTIPSTLTIPAGQSLTGSGTLIVPALTIAGTLSPGNSPGLLSLPSLSLTPTATTLIEIGGLAPGTGFDRIEVAAGASLNGALNIAVLDGFLILEGQRFEFLDAATLTGEFAFTSPLFNGAPLFALEYNAPNATATLIALQSVPEPTALATLAPAALLLTRRRR